METESAMPDFKNCNDRVYLKQRPVTEMLQAFLFSRKESRGAEDAEY